MTEKLKINRPDASGRIVALGLAAVPTIEGSARFLSTRDFWGIPEAVVGAIAVGYIIRGWVEGEKKYQETQVRRDVENVISTHDALRSRRSSDNSSGWVIAGAVGVLSLAVLSGICTLPRINMSSYDNTGVRLLDLGEVEKYYNSPSDFEKARNLECLGSIPPLVGCSPKK